MSFIQPVLRDSFLEFPGGPVPLASRLYIERPPIEQQACAEIEQPGSLIRIQAPRAMGKSSLLNRILAHAEAQGYQIIHLDFQEADDLTLGALNPLLRWFCANASCKLQLPPCLPPYWDEAVGSRVSCSLYWQGYLLNQAERPVVLALSNIDWLFEHPRVAREFLSLLRSWYERAKQPGVWQKLRFILDSCTDAYVPLDIKQSPFDVGLLLKLPPFDLEQIHILAQQYQIGWSNNEVAQRCLFVLKQLTGGHPYLLNLALYQLRQNMRQGGCSSEDCLQQTTEVACSGIYSDHLRRLLNVLQMWPNLKEAFHQVITAEASSQIAPALAYRLDGLGLITRQGNQIRPSCELYRRYFQELLLLQETGA